MKSYCQCHLLKVKFKHIFELFQPLVSLGCCCLSPSWILGVGGLFWGAGDSANSFMIAADKAVRTLPLPLGEIINISMALCKMPCAVAVTESWWPQSGKGLSCFLIRAEISLPWCLLSWPSSYFKYFPWHQLSWCFLDFGKSLLTWLCSFFE